MRTRDVAQICGVSIPTVTENAKKVGIVLENGELLSGQRKRLNRFKYS